jgi:DNA modification methylase
MEINKVIMGDSLDIMKTLPDKSIDLILTDPPYGINENNKFNKMYKYYRDRGFKCLEEQ